MTTQPAETTVSGARVLRAVRPVPAVPAPPVPPPVATAVRAWRAGRGERPLAITGPAGCGKSRLLHGIGAFLADADAAPVLVESVGDEACAEHLIRRVESASRRAPSEDQVLVLDDAERLDAETRERLAQLPRRLDGVRLIASATSPTQLPGAIAVAVPRLQGAPDTAVSDADELFHSEVATVFLECLRRRNPALALERSDHAALAQLCARSFGIPAEVDVLAALVDRHGLAAVAEALGDQGPPQQLADLVGEVVGEIDGVHLTDEEIVVLASVFAAPGGASVDLLRHSLPRCDIDAVTGSLVELGLVLGDGAIEDCTSERFRVRVGATPVASWSADQGEISFPAICHAQADYLHDRAVRLREEMCADVRPAVFAELAHEVANLRCAVSELIGSARYSQAVRLMIDSVPLLARSTGIADLLPDLLRVLRSYTPDDPPERRGLASLAVRVFVASGEQEAAAVHLDDFVDACPQAADDPDVVFLRVLVGDQPASASTLDALAGCLAAYRASHDPTALADVAAEYLPLLLLAGEFARAEDECRVLVSEATRVGDAFAAGVALLWRAAAACATSTDEARHHVERALGKLRPLGTSATVAAIRGVLDNRHLHNLGQRGIDLAMAAGAISRACVVEPRDHVPAPPVLPGVETELAERIGPRAFQRWAAAGAAADIAEMLAEILRRRYVDALPGPVELAGAGVCNGEQVDPAALCPQSTLTPREAEVASLVATGLTNKQVACRLTISEWTVINHLRQVMRKLDCTSRVQVARWVGDIAAAVPM